MARHPARVGDHAAGSGGGEDLDVLARDEAGHRPGEGRVTEDDDAFDLVGERPAQEQPVGPDRVGSDACPGRRFREQWPAGALGEDPGRRAGVVARDHDRALPTPEHLHPRPPPEHLAPRPRRARALRPLPPPTSPHVMTYRGRSPKCPPKGHHVRRSWHGSEEVAEEVAEEAGGGPPGLGRGQQRFLELDVEMGRSAAPGRDLRRRVELLRRRVHAEVEAGGEDPEDPVLAGGLVGTATAHRRRPVGGEDDEASTRVGRLHHRRQQVPDRGTGGRHDGDRRPRPRRQPEREEPRRPLVDPDVEPHVTGGVRRIQSQRQAGGA